VSERTGEAQRAVRVRIEGRVQGVWYRGWTVEEARRRGLDGWVRNRRDGSVEAVFVGPASLVAAMLESCAHGPPAAVVTALAVMDVDSDAAKSLGTKGFRQRATE